MSVDEKSALKIKECLTSSTKLHESSKLLRNTYSIYSRGFFEKGYLNEKKPAKQQNKTQTKHHHIHGKRVCFVVLEGIQVQPV